MGKVVFLALLVGGWWALQNGVIPMPSALAAPSPAWKSYTQFSRYLAHDKYDRAKGMATRAAAAFAEHCHSAWAAKRFPCQAAPVPEESLGETEPGR